MSTLQAVKEALSRGDYKAAMTTVAAIEARAVVAEADNAALLRDSREGLGTYHGSKCTMAGGAHPSSPAECWDLTCREWHARVAQPHSGAALLEEMNALRTESDFTAEALEGLVAGVPLRDVAERRMEELRTARAQVEEDQKSLQRIAEAAHVPFPATGDDVASAVETLRVQVEALGREAQQARDAGIDEALAVIQQDQDAARGLLLDQRDETRWEVLGREVLMDAIRARKSSPGRACCGEQGKCPDCPGVSEGSVE